MLIFELFSLTLSEFEPIRQKTLLPNLTAAEGFIAIGGLKTLLVAVAMCASLAMLLPISTPPNALAHSTGIINTKQMAVVGLIMGVVGIVIAYLMLIFIGI